MPCGTDDESATKVARWCPKYPERCIFGAMTSTRDYGNVVVLAYDDSDSRNFFTFIKHNNSSVWIRSRGVNYSLSRASFNPCRSSACLPACLPKCSIAPLTMYIFARKARSVGICTLDICVHGVRSHASSICTHAQFDRCPCQHETLEGSTL